MLGTVTAWPPGCKTTTLWTFQMFENPQTIYLNRGIDRITAIRVKHIAYAVPITTNDATMLWLSCPELLVNHPSQSVILTNNPNQPDSGNQLANIRSSIASWVVAPNEAGVPNFNNNDPQPTIELFRPTSVNKLTFMLENDGFGAAGVFGPCTVLPSYQLSITLEITCQ